MKKVSTNFVRQRFMDMWRFGFNASVGTVLGVLLFAGVTFADTKPITLSVIGDSLSAGFGLAKDEAFPAQLQRALQAEGHNVQVINAGVSGDTTAGGRARLGWALGDGLDGVILELGANDALRGLPVEGVYENISAILRELAARDIPVLLAGMKAPPNMGEEYADAFERAYEKLAEENDVVFYPFFLAGVAGDPSLNLDDGIHPTADGVAVIVDKILPLARELLARISYGAAG